MSTVQIEKISIPELTQYLSDKKWISDGDEVQHSEPLTQGNMNLCLRVTTQQQKLVIKQGRAWVEKYPHIPAPLGRTTTEALFYKTISVTPELAAAMPRFIGIDHRLQVMATEFIGDSVDGNFIYAEENGSDFFKEWSTDLFHFLQNLSAISTVDFKSEFDNNELKKLNSFHMYDYPFQKEQIYKATQDLNLNLTWLLSDENLQLRKQLIKDYLAPGSYLIHGDFYPGSFLIQKTEKNKKIYVFDPEFCTLGRREFDVGVFLAHVLLGSAPLIETLNEFKEKDYLAQLDFESVKNIAAYEMLRRILGVAQVLHGASNEKKKSLILMAKELLS